MVAHPICVIVPSRERPDDLVQCYQSMLETSTKTKMVVRLDSDNAGIYEQIREMENDRLEVRIGRKIGPAASANEVCHWHREQRIYGMVPDDSKFLTKDWDLTLIRLFDQFSGRIGVVSAHHNGGDYVNFPWVSREWIELCGWYFYPANFHHCCDSVIEMLGECSQSIVYATDQQFAMHHDLKHTFNRDCFVNDATNFLFWCVGERRALVNRIREAKDGQVKMAT